MIPSNRSLHLTVVLPIVIIVLVSMAVVAYVAMYAMREGVRTAAEQRAKYRLAYTRNLIEDIEHLMMVERGVSLQQALIRLSDGPDVDAIRVLSVHGKVLHSSRPGEVGTMLPSHVTALPGLLPGERDPVPVHVRQLGDVLHADGLVLNHPRCLSCHRHGGRVLGVLDVDISLTRQAAGMRTWGRIATAAAILQFVVIALGTILVLGYVVVRPIRLLERSMAEVRLGNYSTTAPPAGTKELDSLVAGFNEMLGRLRHADELEQQVQQSKMARAEQLASVGEFAAGLAHEIRNPLSGIKAAVDVLAGEERAEEPRRILQHVSGELARVDGVVRQLLGFARPKTPVLERVELRSAVEDALLLARPRAQAKRVQLESTCPADPVEVRADQEMVQQMFLNLVLNAMDATEGVPEPRVTVSVEARGGQAWCRVRDNGPGVPLEQVPSLFRPFATTKAKGTGLGLATSRRLAEMQHGQLVLENPGEAGASFAFSLPLYIGSAGR
jgi:signal transduction histidine kinase